MLLSKVVSPRQPHVHRRKGLLRLAVAHHIEVIVLVHQFCIGVIFAVVHRGRLLALMAGWVLLADPYEVLELVRHLLIRSLLLCFHRRARHPAEISCLLLRGERDVVLPGVRPAGLNILRELRRYLAERSGHVW